MTSIINKLFQNTFPVIYIVSLKYGDYIAINGNKYLGTYWHIDMLE